MEPNQPQQPVGVPRSAAATAKSFLLYTVFASLQVLLILNIACFLQKNKGEEHRENMILPQFSQ